MSIKKKLLSDSAKMRWAILLMLSSVMFASYFFDDIFSTISQIFKNPEMVALGWSSSDYGFYGGAYSFLCVWGGLIICGMLLDKWGVKFTGSLFVGLMAGVALLVTYSISESFNQSGLSTWMSQFVSKPSLTLAYAGCAIFGLGSEIAGVAVTRSIAKWFKGHEMALAMGLQLALARLGTAIALVLVPRIVNIEQSFIPYSETSRPAVAGMLLMIIAIVFWAIFIFFDSKIDKQIKSEELQAESQAKSKDDQFKFSDIFKVLSNKHFILVALLCVFFYCCIISFRRFATSIIIPRFEISGDIAAWMVSMIPFCTMIFTPLFGTLVDRRGKGTRLMILGSCLVFVAHLIIAFAPSFQFFGYAGIAILGIGYSLVPAAMWPSVPKIIPEKNLGTAYSLIYWIQNMGLMIVPVIVGKIVEKTTSPVDAEYLFIGLAIVAIIISLLLARSSDKNPQLELDKPNKA